MRRDRSTLLHCLVILGGTFQRVVKVINFLCHRAILEYDIEQYMHISFLFEFKGFSVIVICKFLQVSLTLMLSFW